MASYTPNTELLNDSPEASRSASAEHDSTATPQNRNWIFNVLIGVVLLGLCTFAAIQIGRIYGVDLPSRVMAFIKNDEIRFTSDKQNHTTANQTTESVGSENSHQTADAVPVPVRDMPPQVDPNKPEFAVRDGVTYGYIKNLDTQTLQQLNEVSGRLDDMVNYTEKMGQAVQQFAGVIVPRMQQVEAQQAQLAKAMRALTTQLDQIHASVQDIRVNLLHNGQRSSRGLNVTRTTPIRNWKIQSIQGGRAWVKAPSGKVATVVRGERLKTLGEIAQITQHHIILKDGRYIQ